MKVKDEAAWAQRVEINADPYSKAVIDFTIRWADLMEPELEADPRAFTFAEIAKRCEREADTEGITGFMYGCAVAELAANWVYGEELRRWHNLDTQIGNEGEKANESGGVLNPALINFQEKA